MDPIAALAAAGFDLAQPFDTAAAGVPALADPERRRGLLVGNTRALWPIFTAALRADPALAASPDPLDRYTEAQLARIFPTERLWFGHRRYDGAFLPMQRLAVAAGLGTLAPTQLVIHPTYGPWFALRAVVALPGTPASSPQPSPPCHCDHPCTNALATALAARGPDAWRAWLAVRDACPVGRAHRYSDDQLAYHYTKNRGLLR